MLNVSTKQRWQYVWRNCVTTDSMSTQVHVAQLTREKVERSRAEDIRTLEREMDDRLKIMTETMEAAEDKHGTRTHIALLYRIQHLHIALFLANVDTVV